MSIASMIDHTLLKQDATGEQIDRLCAEAAEYHFASVCVNPYYVVRCVKNLKGTGVKVCTVVGFPLGATTMETKVFETLQAVASGAEEIDMVINVCALKSGHIRGVEQEIQAMAAAVEGKAILKVIIETCLLTDEEKIKMCEIVTKAGADYIKTSTGFSKAGATFEDIQLFSEHIGPNVKMKAAGGISSLDDAQKFLALGADRLGTSRIVKIVKNDEASGY